MMKQLINLETKALMVLLYPMTVLERRMIRRRRGEIVDTDRLSKKHKAIAHVERWGIFALGIIVAAGILEPWWGFSVIVGITTGVILAVFLDPYIWKKHLPVIDVTKVDLKYSLLVNGSVFWMFCLGMLIGSVM